MSYNLMEYCHFGDGSKYIIMGRAFEKNATKQEIRLVTGFNQ